MDKLLLSVVVVSGLRVVSSAAERHYHVVYELKNMTEAQRHCRENYKDLVTIRDLEDLETLNTTLDLSKMAASSSRAWIGLYLDSWRWTLSNTSFFQPEETEFRRWLTGQPDNRFRDEHCTAMISSGEWLDVRCKLSRNPVCFDVKGPQTFVFIDTMMPWTEALNYCREHHTDLPLVRNMEENQMVADLGPPGGYVWLGLHRDGWKWSDGSDYSFENWNPDEPHVHSKNCVAADFSADGQWENQNCDVMSAFICYSAAMPFVDVQSRLGINLDGWLLLQSGQQPNKRAARCHAFEKEWVEFSHGIGQTKTECQLEFEDFYDCMHRQKTHQRLHAIRQQRDKLVKEGTYTPTSCHSGKPDQTP